MPMPDAFVIPNVARPLQDAQFDVERAKLKVTKWDRKSPSNGVPAEHWLGRPDIGAGDAYVVTDETGTVLDFQPAATDPAVEAIGDEIAATRTHGHFAALSAKGTPAPGPPTT
jgi:hypothetical protein